MTFICTRTDLRWDGQLYHSIHAKGENVEDVLREAEAEEADGDTGDSTAQTQAQTQAMDMEADTADVDQVRYDLSGFGNIDGADFLQNATEEQQQQQQKQGSSREIPAEPEVTPIPDTGSATATAGAAATMPHPLMASGK